MYGPPLWVTVYFVENCRVEVPFAYVFFTVRLRRLARNCVAAPLLSARVDELDFCFFFDAGTEIFVEDDLL
jgi:hypothetical protein